MHMKHYFKKLKWTILLFLLLIPFLLSACGSQKNEKAFIVTSSINNIYYGQTTEIKLVNTKNEKSDNVKSIKNEILNTLNSYQSYLSITESSNKITATYNKNKITTRTNIDFNFSYQIETNFLKTLTLHPNTDEEQLNYCVKKINQITFSLLGKKAAENKLSTATSPKVYGTGWLYKHISNYQYYLITNWHVQQLMEDKNVDLLYYSYGVYWNKSYLKFKSAEKVGYCKYQDDPTNTLGVDAYVYKIDFGDEVPITSLKTSLDEINNNLYENNQIIYLNEDAPYNNQEIIVGGYELEELDLPKYYSFSYTGISGFANNDYTVPVESENVYHRTNDKGNKFSIGNSIDVSPSFLKPLTGGGSGAPAVIYDEANDVVKLIGIYWGYWQVPLSGDDLFIGGIESLCNWTNDNEHWANYDLNTLLTQLGV